MDSVRSLPKVYEIICEDCVDSEDEKDKMEKICSVLKSCRVLWRMGETSDDDSEEWDESDEEMDVISGSDPSGGPSGEDDDDSGEDDNDDIVERDVAAQAAWPRDAVDRETAPAAVRAIPWWAMAGAAVAQQAGHEALGNALLQPVDEGGAGDWDMDRNGYQIESDGEIPPELLDSDGEED